MLADNVTLGIMKYPTICIKRFGTQRDNTPLECQLPLIRLGSCCFNHTVTHAKKLSVRNKIAALCCNSITTAAVAAAVICKFLIQITRVAPIVSQTCFVSVMDENCRGFYQASLLFSLTTREYSKSLDINQLSLFFIEACIRTYSFTYSQDSSITNIAQGMPAIQPAFCGAVIIDAKNRDVPSVR